MGPKSNVDWQRLPDRQVTMYRAVPQRSFVPVMARTAGDAACMTREIALSQCLRGPTLRQADLVALELATSRSSGSAGGFSKPDQAKTRTAPTVVLFGGQRIQVPVSIQVQQF